MPSNSEWVTARKATKILGIDRKTLFKYRDDGTLQLGPHYLAFENCFSRDDYKYDIERVKRTLIEKKLLRKKQKDYKRTKVKKVVEEEMLDLDIEL